MDPGRRRPLGIAILSVLSAVGGATMLAMQPFVGLRLSETAGRAGIHWLQMVFAILVLGVSNLLAGIGMWRGTPWGWVLGTFNFLYSFTRNLGALVAIDAMLGDSALAAQASQGPGFYYAKYVGRMVISVLLYLYMFRHQVREYFDIELARPWRWAATQFGLCLALTVMELLVPWLVRPALTGRGLG